MNSLHFKAGRSTCLAKVPHKLTHGRPGSPARAGFSWPFQLSGCVKQGQASIKAVGALISQRDNTTTPFTGDSVCFSNGQTVGSFKHTTGTLFKALTFDCPCLRPLP
eukprot:635550-Pelagomonas_calceolata.AAC.2